MANHAKALAVLCDCCSWRSDARNSSEIACVARGGCPEGGCGLRELPVSFPTRRGLRNLFCTSKCRHMVRAFPQSLAEDSLHDIVIMPQR
jgi:hypothetical protein